MIEYKGKQRLSIEKLQEWEKLEYGMFIHFGMSTYTTTEYDTGQFPSHTYTPTDLDVAQWVGVAKEAGMKYAILTAKHVAGHCLWPSQYTDYTVETSGDSTDVVEKFVLECRRQGIAPGLYYCSWDNHTRLGSVTPSDLEDGADAFTSEAYHDYQSNQIKELLTRYGDLEEIWIDIPFVLGRGYRTRLYHEIAELQPNIKIMMNHGIGDSTIYKTKDAWPSDLIPVESCLPTSFGGYQKKRIIEGKNYYIPGEVCDAIGHSWFYKEEDILRSDEELMGMYLVTKARGANFLLNVPPSPSGRIPQKYVQALMRLKANLEKIRPINY